MRHATWAAVVVVVFVLGVYVGGREEVVGRLTGPVAPASVDGSPGSAPRDREDDPLGQASATAGFDRVEIARAAGSWQGQLERLEVLSRRGDDAAASALRDRLLDSVLELGRDGEAAAARERLDAYLALNPHDPEAYLLDCDLRQMQGRPREAMSPLLELLAFADDPAVVAEAREKLRLLVGVQETQLANAGDLAALVRLFEELTARDPSFDGHRLRLAHWLLRAGRLDEADRVLAETGSMGADAETREQLVAQVRLARTGLPLERHGGALHVNAQVAGKPLRMLVDTGASMTAISRAEVAALDATATGERVRVRTAGGVVEAEVHRVSDVEVGGLRLESLSVLVLDGPLPRGVDGLLGMDVLDHFQAVPGTSLPLP